MPSSHLELAKICAAVHEADDGADAVSFDRGGRQVPIILHHVKQCTFGVATVGFNVPFRTAELVNCICFRGSKTAADFLEDADAILDGGVHQGFKVAYETVRDEVEQEKMPVILCGHSLGGAVATLAALSFPVHEVLEVVTFGCPRVGDKSFKALYAPLVPQTARYVFGADPISWVPFWGWGYRHVKTARWFNGREWQDGFDWLAAAIQWVKGKEGLKALLDQHHIDNYIGALEQS